MVIHDLGMEQVFPNPVKLEFTRLYLAIDWLYQVDPELLQELQAISELNVWPEDHVKDFLIL